MNRWLLCGLPTWLHAGRRRASQIRIGTFRNRAQQRVLLQASRVWRELVRDSRFQMSVSGNRVRKPAVPGRRRLRRTDFFGGRPGRERPRINRAPGAWYLCEN